MRLVPLFSEGEVEVEDGGGGWGRRGGGGGRTLTVNVYLSSSCHALFTVSTLPSPLVFSPLLPPLLSFFSSSLVSPCLLSCPRSSPTSSPLSYLVVPFTWKRRRQREVKCGESRTIKEGHRRCVLLVHPCSMR